MSQHRAYLAHRYKDSEEFITQAAAVLADVLPRRFPALPPVEVVAGRDFFRAYAEATGHKGVKVEYVLTPNPLSPIDSLWVPVYPHAASLTDPSLPSLEVPRVTSWTAELIEPLLRANVPVGAVDATTGEIARCQGIAWEIPDAHRKARGATALLVGPRLGAHRAGERLSVAEQDAQVTWSQVAKEARALAELLERRGSSDALKFREMADNITAAKRFTKGQHNYVKDVQRQILRAAR
jgi:hypothetical protein